MGQQIAKVNAILKKLSAKGLIKALNSVVRGGKKVYMDQEVVPSSDVTGGVASADYINQ